MARKKFQTVTEQMYYVLLFLSEECCGVDIAEKIRVLTNQEVLIGPGTLYTLLGEFEKEGLIVATKTEGRRKSYIITGQGKDLLQKEYQRIQKQLELSKRFFQ